MCYIIICNVIIVVHNKYIVSLFVTNIQILNVVGNNMFLEILKNEYICHFMFNITTIISQFIE